MMNFNGSNEQQKKTLTCKVDHNKIIKLSRITEER